MWNIVLVYTLKYFLKIYFINLKIILIGWIIIFKTLFMLVLMLS